MGRTALAALIAAGVLAGCADDAPKKEPAPKPQQRAKKPAPPIDRTTVLSDFRAMLRADLVAGALENCFARTSSFRRCGGVRVRGVSLGRRAGQVEVELTQNVYRVTGYSQTGNSFRIRLPSGVAFQHFDCDVEDRAGACRNGRWFVPPDLGESSDRVAADMVAQQQVRIAAFYIERCWTDAHTFAKCRAKDALEPYAPEIDPPMRLGTGPGQVEITRTTRRGYAVAARSRSGAVFRAEVGPRRAKLTCTAKQSGGACRKGKWSDGDESRRDEDAVPEAEWT